MCWWKGKAYQLSTLGLVLIAFASRTLQWVSTVQPAIKIYAPTDQSLISRAQQGSRTYGQTVSADTVKAPTVEGGTMDGLRSSSSNNFEAVEQLSGRMRRFGSVLCMAGVLRQRLVHLRVNVLVERESVSTFLVTLHNAPFFSFST